MLCSVCGPFSGHLYEQITDKTVDGLTMKTQFCEDYVSACGSQIDFPSDYCEVHTLNSADIYWSYPYAEEEGEYYIVSASVFVLFIVAKYTTAAAVSCSLLLLCVVRACRQDSNYYVVLSLFYV